MNPRVPPPCPHCGHRPLTMSDLSVHLRFQCSVIRPNAKSKLALKIKEAE